MQEENKIPFQDHEKCEQNREMDGQKKLKTITGGNSEGGRMEMYLFSRDKRK